MDDESREPSALMLQFFLNLAGLSEVRIHLKQLSATMLLESLFKKATLCKSEIQLLFVYVNLLKYESKKME